MPVNWVQELSPDLRSSSQHTFLLAVTSTFGRTVRHLAVNGEKCRNVDGKNRGVEGGRAAVCCLVSRSSGAWLARPVQDIPQHRWDEFFCPRGRLALWCVPAASREPGETLGHFCPMWLVNESAIQLPREFPFPGALPCSRCMPEEQGNHRPTFGSVSLEFPFSFPTSQRAKLQMALSPITACLEAGVACCSSHLDSALVEGPLAWVASQQEIKLPCPLQAAPT